MTHEGANARRKSEKQTGCVESVPITTRNESNIASLHNLEEKRGGETRAKQGGERKREKRENASLMNNIGSRVGGLALRNAQLTTLVVAKGEEDTALRD
jgi:hypothetical protein